MDAAAALVRSSAEESVLPGSGDVPAGVVNEPLTLFPLDDVRVVRELPGAVQATPAAIYMDEPVMGAGLDHPDELEVARRMEVAYGVLTTIYRGEKDARRAYAQQTGQVIATAPHLHNDVRDTKSKCTTCAAHGATNPFLAKLILSRLRSARGLLVGNSSLCKKRTVERYFDPDASMHEDDTVIEIDADYMFAILGEHWFDTAAFALFLSKTPPQELAEFAASLPKINVAENICWRQSTAAWVPAAAVHHLHRLASVNPAWRTVSRRLLAELNLRAAGSLVGSRSAQLVELPPVAAEATVANALIARAS